MEKLENLSINVEEFENTPPKAVLMYKAVHTLLNKGMDYSTIKVSDITKEAGIGKGTAYEYFDSKEEIIAKAMYYEMYSTVKRVLTVIYDSGDFKSKVYKILDYMWDNNMQSNDFQTLIKVMRGTGCPADVLYGFGNIGASVDSESTIPESLLVIDAALMLLLNQGADEGLITLEDNNYRKNAFCSQLVMYIFFLQDKNNMYIKEEVQDFIYQGMIKLLNK